MNFVSNVELKYGLGAKNDTLGKEGLIHFVEHCILKLKIDDINMITLINLHGGKINGSTSMETLKIIIQVSSMYLRKAIHDLIVHIDKFENIKKIDLNFFDNEKKIIIEEQKKNHIESIILGNAETVSNIEQEDVIAVLRHLKDYLLCIYIDNVDGDEYKFVSNELHSFLDIKHYINKEIKKPELYIKVMNNQFDDVDKGSVYNFGSNKYKCINDNGAPFMCISISNNEVIRNNIFQTVCIIRKYLNSRFHNIYTNINYEIGLISILSKGKKDDLLKVIKSLMNFEGDVLLESTKTKHSQHILNEVNDEFLNIDTKINIDLCREINEVLKIYLRNNIAIVTNWNATLDISNILLQDKIGIHDSPLFEKKQFCIKAQKKLSNREKLLVWKGERYLSKNMYRSHIMWSLIDGITGRLYEKLCIKNSCCYSFKFYFRELYDTGYAVLYLISDMNQDYIKYIFKEVLCKLNNDLDCKILENAKKQLILAKGISTDKEKYIINTSCKLLIDKHTNYSADYIEQIVNISLDEVKTYISDFIERDILQ